MVKELFRTLRQFVLKYRWIVFPAGMILAFVLEMVERTPDALIDVDGHFIIEFGIIGIVVPTMMWLILAELVNTPPPVTPLPVKVIQDKATQAERQRISRELHDRLSQNLAFLHLKLDQLSTADDISPDNIGAIQTELEQMRELAHQAYDEVRSTLDNLRSPDPITPLGNLKHALEDLPQQFSEAFSANVSIQYPESARPICPLIEHTLLDVAREALTNIQKHATASQAVISLEFTENDITLHIIDDGCGFKVDENLPNARSHYGLKIMEERILQTGGRFEVISQPDCGTEITARFSNAIVSPALHHNCNSIYCNHLVQNSYEHSVS